MVLARPKESVAAFTNLMNGMCGRDSFIYIPLLVILMQNLANKNDTIQLLLVTKVITYHSTLVKANTVDKNVAY